tara:strand:+ start:588 stop:833 length:246 start_codon:yes stop_codon:yes gene_type:complete
MRKARETKESKGNVLAEIYEENNSKLRESMRNLESQQKKAVIAHLCRLCRTLFIIIFFPIFCPSVQFFVCFFTDIIFFFGL